MVNKELFKKQLRLIEIEIFSYCNRKCWFCPNSFIDRISDNKIMAEETYLDLLSQLQQIDYSGELTYSRYNEPTAKSLPPATGLNAYIAALSLLYNGEATSMKDDVIVEYILVP